MTGSDHGASGGGFPPTRYSAVEKLKSGDEPTRRRALDIIAAAYWKPVYKYVRLKWGRNAQDAEDLTQGFFARAVEKEFFADYDSSRARFRTFVRICLDRHVEKESESAERQKRGGGATMVPYDFARAENELLVAQAHQTASVEELFEREWVRSLFESSLEVLRQECVDAGKTRHFGVFRRYEIDREEAGIKLTYEQLAKGAGLSVSDVTNYLADARRMFRRIVLDKLREQTASEKEFRDEVRALLGITLK